MVASSALKFAFCGVNGSASRRTSNPVSTFQMRTVLSKLLVITERPSCEKKLVKIKS